MKFYLYTLFLLFISNVCADTKNDIKNQPSEIYYKQIQEVFERIDKHYVTEPNFQKMTDAAINGMLNSLDPHSSYFTDEELDDFINHTKGEFGGIGVEVMYDHGSIKVISPIDDLPAYKAGIKAGDYIVGVNDELVANMGFNKAIKEMRGTPGTKVKLMVIGDDDVKPRDINIVREIVKIKPVKYHLEDGNIAYVRIVTFNERAIDELKAAFKSLSNTAGKEGIKGLILDLRNNPGGLLKQAIDVTEFFLDSGAIVSVKDRSGDVQRFTANKFSAKAPYVPMIVLINHGSASASEIVAGALQDNHRALIVGTKSFGKGSVQTFAQISPRAAVKMTTSKYYTPSDRSIQAEGIEPDIVIEQAQTQYNDDNNDKKRFSSEASLKNYIKNDDKSKKSDSKMQDKQDAKQSSELYRKDYQFARSYDIIRGLIVSNMKH